MAGLWHGNLVEQEWQEGPGMHGTRVLKRSRDGKVGTIGH